MNTPSDILIIGGGTGGVAAALGAARAGARVVIAEPTDWLGGQFTAQAVPPDENRWVESFGCNRSYAALREGVRRWYREHRPLTAAAMADPLLNPGGGWVSRLCAEPRVWHEVIVSMLEPFIRDGRVTVLFGHELLAAELGGQAGERVKAVTLRGPDGTLATLSATFVLDATELGDALELCGIEHAIGAEHRAVYGELHGRDDKTHPLDQQACSWCFAVEHRPGENHLIPRPAAYDFWKAYVPEMRDGTAWTGPLFSWTVPSHNAEGRRTFRLVPWPDEPGPGEWEMWRYRRIVDAGLCSSDPANKHPDVSLINMVQMDYWRKPLLGVSPELRAEALGEAKEQSRCLLYWMQTDAPRHDGGTGYPGLRPRGEELGTDDGFAKHVYIREPRRLIARTIMHEGHVGSDQRRAEGRAVSPGAPADLGSGEAFDDSVAIGHYTIDLHPSCAGRNSVYVPCAPFRVPMGALIPKRVRNVLAAGKCMGVSHVVNASTRMHTTEWAVGEAAGILASWCVAHGKEPHWVHDDIARVREVQQAMARQGVAMAWPWEG